MYFAWVGLFTGMLAALAIIGLIVFLYGIGSAGDHSPKRSVQCSYWDLTSTTCVYAYVSHFFEKDWTVGLAVIASIWEPCFLSCGNVVSEYLLISGTWIA